MTATGTQEWSPAAAPVRKSFVDRVKEASDAYAEAVKRWAAERDELTRLESAVSETQNRVDRLAKQRDQREQELIAVMKESH